MRVIAGSARGRPLMGPPGTATRPTSDKVKGALFSMIEAQLLTAPWNEDDQPPAIGTEEPWKKVTVLDLYAGTGALGLEALSRGARWCDFVESNGACRRVIDRNLIATGLIDRARVIGRDVRQFVQMTARDGQAAPYNLVVMDPPYGDLGGEQVIADLDVDPLLSPGAIVGVEHSRRVTLAPVIGSLRLLRDRRHGDTVISIYRRGQEG